jgi:hypothetical protein
MLSPVIFTRTRTEPDRVAVVPGGGGGAPHVLIGDAAHRGDVRAASGRAGADGAAQGCGSAGAWSALRPAEPDRQKDRQAARQPDRVGGCDGHYVGCRLLSPGSWQRPALEHAL